MIQPRTSVVLCTYNGAAYLPMQLDSLLAQSRLPDEIVMSDDASSDATAEILRHFAERAEARGIAVRLWQHPENLGYVANFSSALVRATGDLLFLCDQDDVWHRDKLARMVACFAEHPELLLLHSDARLVDANGASLGCLLFDALQLTSSERGAIHRGDAFEVILRRSFVTGATAALRRHLVDLALPIATGWIHDEWLAAVAAACGRVDFIAEPLVDYRQHAGNQIGARKRTWATKWRELLHARGQPLRDEALRLRLLEEALERIADASYAGQMRDKRRHFEQRVLIGRMPRWRRLRAIGREARSGGYRRYGTGSRSMLRDLLRHD